MKKILYFIILLIFFSSCGQEPVRDEASVDLMSQDILRQIPWEQLVKKDDLYYAASENIPFTGIAIGTYSNRDQAIVVPLQAGRLDGTAETWRRNGQKKASLIFKDNILIKKTIYDQNNKSQNTDDLNYEFKDAQVFVKPAKQIITASTDILVNISKIPVQVNKDIIIQGFPMETIVEKSIKINTATKIFKGTNASGEVVFVNTNARDITFKPQTRLKSSEGLTFRTTDWVRVPAFLNGKNGEVQIKVNADENDIQGVTIGERGNLKAPQRLEIAEFSSVDQALIWAEVRTDFTGGMTAYETRISEADFAAAREEIIKVLQKEAGDALKKVLLNQNIQQKRDLLLIPENPFTKKEIIKINLPSDLLNTNAESFEASGTMKMQHWAISQEAILALLTSILQQKLAPNQTLDSIDPNSIIIDLSVTQTNPESVNLIVSAQGNAAFGWQGDYLIKLKQMILGKSIEEAEQLLSELPEIETVHIATWPFASKVLPRLEENVSVERW